MTSKGVIAGRHRNVGHLKWFLLVLQKLRRRTEVRTPGTVMYLFSGRNVVPQGPVKWMLLRGPYLRPRDFYLVYAALAGAAVILNG